MAVEIDVLHIWNDVRGKGEKEIKAAAKDLLKIGRDAFGDFVKDIGGALTSEQTKQIADLYARAEIRALSGNSASANRVIARLNLTARAAANVKRSQTTKKAIAVWNSALKVLSSLASSLASVGSAGLSDLAKAGLDMATEAADDLVSSVSKSDKKEAKKAKKAKKSKKKDEPKDDDVIVEDD